MFIKKILPAIFFCTSCTAAYAQQTTKEPATKPAQTLADKLKLYPNPAKTYVNIYVDWKQAQPFSITIYDMQYNSQLNEIKVGARKSYQYALDVSQLPPGKYRITINGTTKMEEMLTVVR